MEIRLISENAELAQICHEIVAEFREQTSTLTVVSTPELGTNAELYIWDFYPKISLPEPLHGSAGKHLFLVDRKDLEHFRSTAGHSEAFILLKPVSRPALRAFLELAASSDTTTALLADRDEILQCLIQTNLKLQEYDHDRTTFLARGIHDFRAPLTALSGYCQLLLSGSLGPINEKQKQILARMNQSLDRLSRLTNSMYHLSIGRQVTTRPNLQKGSIRDAVDQAVHEIAGFASDKQITVSVELEPSQELYFERGQLEQVLVNLLDNACKFTPRLGRIEIRGYAYSWERWLTQSGTSFGATAHNSYRVDVHDSGALIPAERLNQIFEEYVSYGGSFDRSGCGLGLAICRMIITQHEGTIWAENSDQGPIFSFVLPTHCPASQCAPTIELESLEV